MHGDDGYFDERVAARYDESSAEMFSAEAIDPTVDFLTDLAGDGPALEFAVGTGRIALPLAQRGVAVHGIDMSKAMVARMRAKPGGNDIGVTIGDFSTTTVEGPFSLRNAAAHLQPGGCFVIEVGVPSLRLLPPGETIHAFTVTENRWGFDEYDIANQRMTSHHFEIVDGRAERFAVPFRYAFPAEYDLMAELAGMRLRERWAGWDREPFTSESRSHVSVWERPAT